MKKTEIIEEKLKNDIAEVRNEVRNRMLKYILAALGLVAGLAWNDAIRSLIEYVFPLDQSSIKAKMIYAIVITLVVVVLSYYLAKIGKLEEEKLMAEKKKTNEKLVA